MATAYGKELRRIRISRDLLLKNMADSLGITSAYLSSIEMGKRKIPDTMTREISEKYNLSKDELIALERAEDAARNSIAFDFSKTDRAKKEVVLALARKFDEITDQQVEAIKRILRKGEV